ncbi:hypothetical protein QFC19_001234 [Naganishia cerealis]|uniref:Uncharacterized protein n=1 Tax=Naganishia cerealis TaxID=610337 RepID=A0ACC2WJV6_9TREE|nr:hypothetical protein QFC19_001234 [Naganishia cerealis]
MPSPSAGHGQLPAADPASDFEIIEVGDSPVKRRAPGSPPKPLYQRKRKAEAQVAPVFSQMAAATANTSTSTSTPHKRQRDSSDESAKMVFSAYDKARGQSTQSSGPFPVGNKGSKVDPLKAVQPLAERMRPTELSSYVGQLSVVGPGSLLGSMLEDITHQQESTVADKRGGQDGRLSHEVSASLGSMIFWGPPGSGKTTLARLIASKIEADFRELSATSSGAADVRKVFEQAKNQLRLTGSVFTLEKHSVTELEQILRNALSILPPPIPRLPPTLIPFLAEVSDGDARQALNSLELALSVCKKREAEVMRYAETRMKEDGNGNGKASVMTLDHDANVSAEADADHVLMTAIKQGLRKGYDRTGEERYDMISALHKSIRGSDGSAALYWLARTSPGTSLAPVFKVEVQLALIPHLGRTGYGMLSGLSSNWDA